MSTRRAVPAFLAIVFAIMFFGLGNYLAARQSADHVSSAERSGAGPGGNRSGATVSL